MTLTRAKTNISIDFHHVVNVNEFNDLLCQNVGKKIIPLLRTVDLNSFELMIGVAIVNTDLKSQEATQYYLFPLSVHVPGQKILDCEIINDVIVRKT